MNLTLPEEKKPKEDQCLLVFHAVLGPILVILSQKSDVNTYAEGIEIARQKTDLAYILKTLLRLNKLFTTKSDGLYTPHA